jgi:spore coat polysaccharide biosynthesis predicted glycosyltransferase SpsG
VSNSTRAVTICWDVEGDSGATRLVRCLAVAEELLSRGVRVTFVCDTEGARWAEMQLRARGLDVLPPPTGPQGYADLFDRLSSDAVVFDATMGGQAHTAVRETGRPTLAIAAADRGVEADIVVVPDVDAEDGAGTGSSDSAVLAGPAYALIRNDVLANRPISPPERERVEVPQVTAVFDDAESAEAGAAVAQVLAATGRPFDATFVVADGQAGSDIAAVRLAPRQRIEVAEPSWRLHERLVRSDAVLGAAGPSTDEWLCLGASVGLVWASDDHVDRYRRLMVRRVVVGVGAAGDLANDPTRGVEKMTRLLSDARERSRLGEAGWRLVDGFGRARVVDALLARVERH